MKFKHLLLQDGKKITNNTEIIDHLRNGEFNWLIDSEFESAEIEIKNNTILWHNGTWYDGEWYYGIWLNGEFNGKWSNGVWEGGNFNGTWGSGINNSGQEIK